MKRRLIVISGNIGVGKTTLAKALALTTGWRCELESVADNPYLDDFYRDMRAWGLQLQFYFLSHRAEQHQRAANSTDTVILDRSLYEDAEIFAAALYHAGHITDRDHQTYRRVFNSIVKGLPHPDLIIYLRAPIPTLLDRIRARGRPFEIGIDESYLLQLNEFYDRWIGKINFAKVLVLDHTNVDSTGAHIDRIVEMTKHLDSAD